MVLIVAKVWCHLKSIKGLTFAFVAKTREDRIGFADAT